MRHIYISNFFPKTAYPIRGLITLKNENQEIKGKFHIDYNDLFNLDLGIASNNIKIHDFSSESFQAIYGEKITGETIFEHNKNDILSSKIIVHSSQYPKSWQYELQFLISKDSNISIPPEDYFDDYNDFVRCKKIAEFKNHLDHVDFLPISVIGMGKISPEFSISINEGLSFIDFFPVTTSDKPDEEIFEIIMNDF